MNPASVLLLAFAADVYCGQGELSGEPTQTTVLLQTRLTAIPGPQLSSEGDVPGAAGVVCFEWGTTEQLTEAFRTDWQNATADHDFIVRTKLSGLIPGTEYFYRCVHGLSQDVVQTGPVRRFRTLPANDSRRSVSFCMGSCMNYHSFMHGKPNGGGPVTATEEDKALGYPSFAAMTALRPDFFIGTGDIVYYDHPPREAAQTVPELRRKWHEQFRFPRLIDFFSRTPAYWSKDDHDFRFNDADTHGARLPSTSTGIGLFREQLPIVEAGDADSPTYRTHRIHRDVQLWFLEGRDYRSDNRQPDGPEKTIWGKEQKQWLQQTLLASDATWKILISPTPMVGPDRNSKTDNHANLAGFRYEADSFFQWLKDHHQDRVLCFCGDRHWQYHSIHPMGVEEFCTGALNDENAIRGEKPGGKKTTDPEGLIRQPYIYKDPTGGFLHVKISSPTDQSAELIISHYDDTGRILNSVTKTAAE
ncbi:MAG: alkaline phosphatase D family protein [Planctomycetaceae bacterium]